MRLESLQQFTYICWGFFFPSLFLFCVIWFRARGSVSQSCEIMQFTHTEGVSIKQVFISGIIYTGTYFFNVIYAWSVYYFFLLVVLLIQATTQQIMFELFLKQHIIDCVVFKYRHSLCKSSSRFEQVKETDLNHFSGFHSILMQTTELHTEVFISK